VNVAVQPASHSWLMEMREVSPRAGNRWAVQAEMGRRGRCKSTWWEETITEWSARETWRAGDAMRLLE
jgi:hypothetical protein